MSAPFSISNRTEVECPHMVAVIKALNLPDPA
jgi:hypothetical protein